MKLSKLIANPELATSSKSRYQYEILIRGEKTICSSHVETVITTLKLLADKKIINLTDIEESEKIAGFNLILDVSDLKADEIPDMMKTFNDGKWKNRYQVKKLLVVGKSSYIVCREWTVERVDDFVNKFMSIANKDLDKVKDKKDFCSVTRK
jgi:hypothetical protein